MLIGGVTDPPAARAAAPMLHGNLYCKTGPGLSRVGRTTAEAIGPSSPRCSLIQRLTGYFQTGIKFSPSGSSLLFVPLRSSSAHIMPWFFRLYRVTLTAKTSSRCSSSSPVPSRATGSDDTVAFAVSNIARFPLPLAGYLWRPRPG